jgi:branched-chain amino acid transport system substrate-binding protein
MWKDRRHVLTAGGLGIAATMLGLRLPTFAAEPFRVGALNPVTGAGAPYGGTMQKAILFSAEEVNAAGGAAGRTLEILAEDSQTSPEAGVLAVKKLIEVNKVNAIVGTWASAVVMAVGPIIDNAGLIHMTNAGTSLLPTIDKKHLIYRYSATSLRVGEVLGKALLKDSLTKVATMAINNPSGLEVAQGAKEVIEGAGHKLVGEVVYEPNRPSYRSELQKVLIGNPQIIVMGSFLPDMTVVVREARQMGSDVRFIGPAWAANPQLIASLGAEATEGMLTADYVSALDSAAFKHFKTRFMEVVGSDPTENYFAACAYDMVQVLALGIEAAGASADTPAIANAFTRIANPPGKAVSSFAEGKKLLAAGEKINYEGASGPIDFDEKRDVKAAFKLSVFRNGKVEFLHVIS